MSSHSAIVVEDLRLVLPIYGAKPRKGRPQKPLPVGGTLRAYQREGLGWLEFLREYGLGGVLADDMGLGKTVQVLALIKAWRTASKTTKKPFLVVAPRSLVFNWVDEASRFTPKLKVAQYLGASREKLKDDIGRWDLLITSYGTMRRDVGFLASVEFDTVILDEAHQVPDLAVQFFGVAIGSRELQRVVDEVRAATLSFGEAELQRRLDRLDIATKALRLAAPHGSSPFILCCGLQRFRHSFDDAVLGECWSPALGSIQAV